MTPKDPSKGPWGNSAMSQHRCCWQQPWEGDEATDAGNNFQLVLWRTKRWWGAVSMELPSKKILPYTVSHMKQESQLAPSKWPWQRPVLGQHPFPSSSWPLIPTEDYSSSFTAYLNNLICPDYFLPLSHLFLVLFNYLWSVLILFQKTESFVLY